MFAENIIIFHVVESLIIFVQLKKNTESLWRCAQTFAYNCKKYPLHIQAAQDRSTDHQMFNYHCTNGKFLGDHVIQNKI